MSFEEIIEKQGFLIYTNVGMSMLPILREGRDLMYIEKIKEPLKKYDAVLFRRDNIKGRGEYVLHRILKVYKNNTYFIIGDSSFHGEVVKKENIIGILKKVKRDQETIDCDSFKYKLFVRYIWFIYPLRYFKRMIVKLINKLGL